MDLRVAFGARVMGGLVDETRTHACGAPELRGVLSSGQNGLSQTPRVRLLSPDLETPIPQSRMSPR
jgi:hypothetical protein